MKTSDFDYELPQERIAQQPAEPRDSARLMVVRRPDGQILHKRFRDLPDLLNEGDLLVANDSRVLHARLYGHKHTGGAVEALVLRRISDTQWEALVRGTVRRGTLLTFDGQDGSTMGAEVVALLAGGRRLLRFEGDFGDRLEGFGEVPLPPYIHQPLSDTERYQTVYSRVAGSAAAPTAGLHFTPELVDHLSAAAVEFAFVTLHVGVDTFRPVATDLVEEHRMHSEWCQLSPETARRINSARQEGRRIVAIGTTAVRVLETAAAVPGEGASAGPGRVEPYDGWTDLFISPGYVFRLVDALITNFHYPRSTLIMLVSAFAGKALVDRAYSVALDGDYRFFSFGDAMLIE